MPTVREKHPGQWEVRVFAGRDDNGKPVQISRVVRGTKRDAERVAARLTLRPTPLAGRRTIGELIDEYVLHKSPTWAVQTRYGNIGIAREIKADPIAGLGVAKLRVLEVDTWVLRMREAGVGEAALKNRHAFLRACFQQALRWEWVTHNPVAAATLRRGRAAETGRDVPRGSAPGDRGRG